MKSVFLALLFLLFAVTLAPSAPAFDGVDNLSITNDYVDTNTQPESTSTLSAAPEPDEVIDASQGYSPYIRENNGLLSGYARRHNLRAFGQNKSLYMASYRYKHRPCDRRILTRPS